MIYLNYSDLIIVMSKMILANIFIAIWEGDASLCPITRCDQTRRLHSLFE